VVESTYGWYWLADKLEQRQIPFKLAHPKKVNAIADKKKTDREDAKILADLLRTNLLPTSYIPKKKTRAVKELYRFRMGLVEQRANSKRRLHDILRKQNLTCPYTDILGKRSLKWLIEKRMPFPYKGETKSLIKIAAVLNQQINIYDKRIKQLTADNPEAKLLRTIPGVGAILSLIIAMEIGEISRFANRGNKYLRLALTEAAPHLIRKDPLIKAFYQRLKSSKGASKAKVAVMNKLSRIIYVILAKKKPFQLQERLLINQSS